MIRTTVCSTDYNAASLPDMWDRTVSIYSAGKIFSVTGWKLGFAIGPKHLISAMATVHQNCVYTCPTPAQVFELLMVIGFINPQQVIIEILVFKLNIEII